MLPETASKLGIRFETFFGECIELELAGCLLPGQSAEQHFHDQQPGIFALELQCFPHFVMAVLRLNLGKLQNTLGQSVATLRVAS